MTQYKSQIFIGVSILVLIILLMIQVQWINQARKLNEEQFRHLVGLALHESVSEFMEDQQSCYEMSECMKKLKSKTDSARLKSEIKRLNLIIENKFKQHQINSNYTIEVLSKADKQPRSRCFYYSMQKALSDDKAMLNVYFDKREKNILDSMGTMFIASLVAIIILFSLFGITVLSLLRDKKILGRTTDLINNIAHEFKTPMASIGLACGMLKRDRVLSSPDNVIHYSDIIHTENNRLRQQVEQLLKLACIERGELKLNVDELSIHSLLSECASCLDIHLKERNGTIEFDLKATRDYVKVDQDLLQNVFKNLIDNALKYSPESPKIKISTETKNNELCISISDQGIGMTREEQKLVFDRYYRAHTGDIHNVKGFGIGLSYCKMIIDAHKGSIKVWSKKNIGSTFTVVLPLS
ncbi:sensor histidine kinase [Ancylomarina euxinus]|uniref:histidine kinase n=1 Tax=Ancylomarina euxinus TaxID=2283627 RepID=A0A425Y034_9BACT|nr:HAMP domain-containing sensor histidine kinase [Ancylomarina euxinus]MCZ4695378.1 HAMP domain-containing sensor histidine kinase [Ancylomarina euxinus]MUP15574.1 GHKL domain-containing protein [Ancylomarina euxinus]RRG20982.1 sensor histidine kinase [Ancylomarina euxinus]